MIDNELEEIVLAMEQAGESPEAIGQVIEEYEAKKAQDSQASPNGESMTPGQETGELPSTTEPTEEGSLLAVEPEEPQVSDLDTSINLVTLSQEQRDGVIKDANRSVAEYSLVKETKGKDTETVKEWITSNPDAIEPPQMWNEGLKHEFRVQKANESGTFYEHVDPRETVGSINASSALQESRRSMAMNKLFKEKVESGELEEDQVKT